MTKRNSVGHEGLRQRTLRNAIHCSGIGLHSGAKVNMTLHPAPANHGIIFRRSDIANSMDIAANWQNAVETPMCTTLVGSDGAKVATVEHLMSALSGSGIDNATVELNGPEVPVMDGSAAPFVFLVECAGTVEQSAPRRVLEIRKPVSVSDPHRSATLLPGQGLWIEFEIDFDSRAVARQEWSIQVTQDNYKRDISRARTFGFLREVDELRKMGLGRGGSLDNTVVVDGDGILNDGGLRYGNEFVRHKVLDMIGDLYLAGAPVVGRVRGARSGHALTLRLLKALFADSSAWSWRDITAADIGTSADESAMGATATPARAVAARA
ncbi:MAG: UDP-3-O-acyl-N-acetylglucosamine deacetylase [Alphaproteobacteria bacterium]